MSESTAETGDTGIAAVLGILRSLNLQDLDHELRRLQGIREWAFDHLGIDYRAGDQVRVVSPIPGRSTNGWAPYAECLQVGATGTVKRIEFVPPFGDRPGRWFADFVPDREWAASNWSATETRRYWHGPLDETPEGYQPPSDFEAKTYPDGRRHTFMFDVEWLAADVASRPGQPATHPAPEPAPVAGGEGE